MRGGLFAGLAAGLGAQVAGLGTLTSDTRALVVHRGAAVQVLTDFDSGAGIGAALRARRDGDETASK